MVKRSKSKAPTKASVSMNLNTAQKNFKAQSTATKPKDVKKLLSKTRLSLLFSSEIPLSSPLEETTAEYEVSDEETTAEHEVSECDSDSDWGTSSPPSQTEYGAHLSVADTIGQYQEASVCSGLESILV